jgi:hypothetical protein
MLNISVMAVFISLSKSVSAIADQAALKLHVPAAMTLSASASSVGSIFSRRWIVRNLRRGGVIRRTGHALRRVIPETFD